ncbi:MAG: LytTR family DNA-binding domain-containing protein [Spirosomataceae bacterium]
MITLNTKIEVNPIDILFLKSHINYTEFLMKSNRKILLSYTMGSFEKRLKAFNFKRVHRSYLVNMEHVVATEIDQVILSNGLRIPMSRRKRI